MRWLLQQIAGGVIRFLVAALIGAAFIAYGLAPEQIVASWMGEPPRWVVNPWTRIALVIVGAAVIVGSYFFEQFRKRTSAPPVVPGRGPHRLSLIEFRNAAIASGWQVQSTTSLDGADLLEGLRQAGLDGAIRFWGRQNRNEFESLNRREPLVEIPASHWRDWSIDWHSVIPATDNFQTRDENPLADRLPRREPGAHLDLHLDREAALDWLRSEALNYRGAVAKRHPRRSR